VSALASAPVVLADHPLTTAIPFFVPCFVVAAVVAVVVVLDRRRSSGGQDAEDPARRR
jgi:hypothetical protein